RPGSSSSWNPSSCPAARRESSCATNWRPCPSPPTKPSEGARTSDLSDHVGARVADDVPPYVWDASVDTIRNFARAYGDDNPLYSDPDYARASARGALVAPPLFPMSAGLPAADPRDGLDLNHVLDGYMQAIAGDRWTLCRPVRAGVRLMRE